MSEAHDARLENMRQQISSRLELSKHIARYVTVASLFLGVGYNYIKHGQRYEPQPAGFLILATDVVGLGSAVLLERQRAIKSSDKLLEDVFLSRDQNDANRDDVTGNLITTFSLPLSAMVTAALVCGQIENTSVLGMVGAGVITAQTWGLDYLSNNYYYNHIANDFNQAIDG